jgi:signal peptidase I
MDINFPLVLTLLVFISGFSVIIARIRFCSTERSQKILKFFAYIGSFFPVLIFVFILRSFIFEPFQIPSGSMIPTLKIGDYILVNKFSYGLRLPVIRSKFFDVGNPKRGDVMVFTPPHDKRYFIKRVIGLPGDKISIKNNIIYINDIEMEYTVISDTKENPNYVIERESLDEIDHLVRKKKTASKLGKDYNITIPTGQYFMVGDNRDNSSDSRVWGPVPETNIVGKAILVWMHWRSISDIPSFKNTGVIK